MAGQGFRPMPNTPRESVPIEDQGVDSRSSRGYQAAIFSISRPVRCGAVGVAFALWPFIDQMNPDASVMALSSIEVDLAPIAEGQAITSNGAAIRCSSATAPQGDRGRQGGAAGRSPDREARNANLPDRCAGDRPEPGGRRQGEMLVMSACAPIWAACRSATRATTRWSRTITRSAAGSVPVTARITTRRDGSERDRRRKTCTCRYTPMSTTAKIRIG